MIQIGKATPSDVDGIVALQAENQVAKGGMLAAAIPAARLRTLMNCMPQLVAKRNGHVVGFLMTHAKADAALLPVTKAMFDAYPGAANAYAYGPVCVDSTQRGQGLAAAMFSALRVLEPDREGVLFIRCDNVSSLRAHDKMGMTRVASFRFEGLDFAVFSYIG